ncbi:hypothetical protein D3C71_1843040 [compost metagenome]
MGIGRGINGGLNTNQESFIKSVREASAAFFEMSKFYEEMTEEEREVLEIDELYPKNLKSMDEQAVELINFSYKLEENVKK